MAAERSFCADGPATALPECLTKRNCPTSCFNSDAMDAITSAAPWVLRAPPVVASAASATLLTFPCSLAVPSDTQVSVRRTSVVIDVCSSTAAATVVEKLLTLSMTERTALIASTARLVSSWIALIFWSMSSVALAVPAARSFTSRATIANPLPASPARAASMVAFNASRLVWAAIEVITLTTSPISLELVPRRAIVWCASSTKVTASLAIFRACWALTVMSRMASLICAADADTV